MSKKCFKQILKESSFQVPQLIMEDDRDDVANQSFSSIEGLEDLTWDGLLDVCKEKNEQLNLAGACGLKLHEQLMESQAHIDEMRVQHDTEIEVLNDFIIATYLPFHYLFNKAFFKAHFLSNRTNQ